MRQLGFGERELPDEPLGVLAGRLRRRELSPVELASAVIERIQQRDGVLRSFVSLADSVLDDAKRAEAEILAGDHRGPLHGIPVAHKDVLATSSCPTTANSEVLRGQVPDADAAVVAALAERGAILVGKTATYEFACGGHGFTGTPRNPWSLGHTTGGSSSGSAGAVGSGMAVAATGTDTGGSIRVPASFCGLVGLKPTYDLVARQGLIPVSWSLDHIGFIARSTLDAAIMLGEALAGGASGCAEKARVVEAGLRELGDAASDGAMDLRGVRLGVPEEYFEAPVSADIKAAAFSALVTLADLGAEVVAVRLPVAPHSAAAVRAILWPEATFVHREWLTGSAESYGPATRRNVLIGGCLSAEDYLAGQLVREGLRRALAAALVGVDALVWPTLTRTAFAVGEPESWIGMEVRLANLAGTPSLTLPCGFGSDGLPVGLQINGRAYDDAKVLRIALAYEMASEFHRYLPSWPRDEEPTTREPQRAPSVAVTGYEAHRLEGEIAGRLRERGLPCLEEDLPHLASMLEGFRSDLRAAMADGFEPLEPLVKQPPLA